MAISKRDPFEDNWKHLSTLPDYVLFDIARNESAQRDYRLKAVEHLYVRKSSKVQHAELRELVHQLKIELEGIEFEHPAPSGPGPLIASVTTETMFSDGPVPKVSHESELEEISGPSEPLSRATVEPGNSILRAYTPEENIMRDPDPIPEEPVPDAVSG